MSTPATSSNPGAPASPTPAPAQTPRNGFGITALCLSLVGLLFGLVPLTGFIALGLGVLALVFGALGFSRARKGVATNKKMSGISLLLAAGAVALGIWGMTIVFNATEDLVNDLDKVNEQIQQGSNSLDQFDDTMHETGKDLQDFGTSVEQQFSTPEGQ